MVCVLIWVAALKVVVYTHFDTCEYDTPWKKSTCILHNTPCPHQLVEARKRGRNLRVLSGKVWYRGAWVFRTALACHYQPELCSRAVAMVSTLCKQGRERSLGDKERCHGTPDCITKSGTQRKKGMQRNKRKCRRIHVRKNDESIREKFVHMKGGIDDASRLQTDADGYGVGPCAIHCATVHRDLVFWSRRDRQGTQRTQ